jgi:hypothetical protein
MPVLTTQQRSRLENVVIKARKVAETGARNALNSLAVGLPEPYEHMTHEKKALRSLLRNKALLLGDKISDKGEQEIDELVYELAYEYWHKMLFAKFLESNNLLMHSQGVAVTLDECEELAKEERYIDKWDAAAMYASKMLPAIFRPEDPFAIIKFATEDRINLENLLSELDEFTFKADDSLGWVYQYWQSEAKDAINKSGEKIDGKKLPAVTQLFTEPYMVQFLIDNTIGAWWVSRNPGKISPVEFEYLRKLDDGTPAAGKFEGWPNTTAEITILDPCMGSGHFIVSLFNVLVKLRMLEEGLSKEEVTNKVIKENLNGLEIDPRCTQIAAFNLALAAWKFCNKYTELPDMNLACSGIAPKGKAEDWSKLVGNLAVSSEKSRLENGMKMLYSHFQLAPELGSLIDPSSIKPDAFIASFDELQPILIKALKNEGDKDQVERGVVAAGIAKAGMLLARRYVLQITNVPYLQGGKQDFVLSNYCSTNYTAAKGDLATVFFEKMIKSSTNGGSVCCVIPQNWLFLTSYKIYRESLLKKYVWSLVARLGPKGFQTPMWDFNVMLIIIKQIKPTPVCKFYGLDISSEPNAASKDRAIKVSNLKPVKQLDQLLNPDSRVVLESISSIIPLLDKVAESGGGVSTFDSPRFIQNFWEHKSLMQEIFILCQSSPNKILFSGRNNILKWENGKGELFKLMKQKKELENYTSGIWIVWSRFIQKKGVCVSMMGDLSVSFYDGYAFDNNTGVVIPEKEEHLPAIWAYCSSPNYQIDLRKLDQKLNITSGTLVKVPFDLEYWKKVAEEKYPSGLPKPYCDDLKQWLFHGNPVVAEKPLQVSISRLIGYRWPVESDDKIELSDEAKLRTMEIKLFNNLSDEDGILCIPSVNGEMSASERLRSYIQAVYASDWNNETIPNLLLKEGSKKSNLEDWLREEFFEQHYKLFLNRPFIWHIWDGRKDGFGALVNYHRLDKEKLKRLIYTYLGDWIRQCEAKKKSGESGAEGLLIAAQSLKKRLLAVLEGEPPFDIFVRWKKLEEQPIGWEPDLNDGVRLNIRPFIKADVLRKKPNIKWGVDRGKNPPGNPWGEIRDNDLHLTLAEKKEAREKIKK